jgi:GT2 family glycosyltransferase
MIASSGLILDVEDRMHLSGGVSQSISVIVVNWNQIEYLRNCLQSLTEQAPRETEVVVVDNASTDGSVEMVEAYFPKVNLVKSSTNLGWVGGVNLGFRRSAGEIAFLLNNDTEIGPGCVEAVMRAFRRTSVAIVGCRVYDLRDRRREHEAGMSIDRFGFMIPFPDRRLSLPPFYVSGTGLAVRRSDAEELGLFDERFHVYSEDIDLCWRYRLAGREIDVARDAVVYHAIGGSVAGGVKGSGSYETSKRRVYLRERNAIAMMIKNYSAWSLMLILPTYLLLLVLESLISVLTLRPAWGIQCLHAVIWNMRNLYGTLRLRRSVQTHRRVRDRDLPFDSRFGKVLAFRSVGLPRLVQ